MNANDAQGCTDWIIVFDLLSGSPSLQLEDPEAVVRSARGHGLGPMLLQLARNADLAPFGATLDVLAGEFERSIFEDLHLDAEAKALFVAINDAELRGEIRRPPLALKGLHLKHTLYASSPHLRTMGDIDILVHAEEERALSSLLSDNGFSRVGPTGPSLHERWGHATTWYKRCEKNRVVRVDVHRNFTHLMRGAKLPDRTFERSVSLSDAPRMSGLSAPDLIAHLCLHLGHEFFRGPLKGLVDVRRLLDTLDVDALKSRQDLFWDPARPSLSVTLGILERRGSWERGRPLFGVYPASGQRFERLFPDARLFDGKKARAQGAENTRRALYLIHSPVRKTLFPAYLAVVYMARAFRSISAFGNSAECPRPEGP